MTDKELKKLNKTELLWIIHDQEEEIIELKNKLESFENKSEDIVDVTEDLNTVESDGMIEEKSEEQFEENVSEEITDDKS